MSKFKVGDKVRVRKDVTGVPDAMRKNAFKIEKLVGGLIVVYGLSFDAGELKKAKPKKEFKLGENPENFSEDYPAARGWASFVSGARAMLVDQTTGSKLIGLVTSGGEEFHGYFVTLEGQHRVALSHAGKWDYYKEVK